MKNPQTKETEVANNYIIEQTALALGLPISLVKEVIKIQPEYTVHVMRQGSLDYVIWPALGRFRVKPATVLARARANSEATERRETIAPGETAKAKYVRETTQIKDKLRELLKSFDCYMIAYRCGKYYIDSLTYSFCIIGHGKREFFKRSFKGENTTGQLLEELEYHLKVYYG